MGVRILLFCLLLGSSSSYGVVSSSLDVCFMLCHAVTIFEKPVLFKKEQWILGRGGGAGKSGERGDCGKDMLYERS